MRPTEWWIARQAEELFALTLFAAPAAVILAEFIHDDWVIILVGSLALYAIPATLVNLAFWRLVRKLFPPRQKAPPVPPARREPIRPVTASPPPEKDPRLTLLLELLSDEERQEMARRLFDELRMDGEVIALEELLAEMGTDRLDYPPPKKKRS